MTYLQTYHIREEDIQKTCRRENSGGGLIGR